MCSKKNEQEKNTWNNQTRTSYISCRALEWRKRLLWKRLNAEEPQDGIDLGGKYEDLLKGANKKIINFLGKQGELLKRFRYEDKFFDRVGLSQSNIYFKISLYKFLRKFLLMQNSTLASSYFKTNFKVIKKVCRANVNIFSKEK